MLLCTIENVTLCNLFCVILFFMFIVSHDIFDSNFHIRKLLLPPFVVTDIIFILFFSLHFTEIYHNKKVIITCKFYVVICNALYASNTDIVITSLIYFLVQLFSTISFSSFFVYYIIILFIVAVVISCLL